MKFTKKEEMGLSVSQGGFGWLFCVAACWGVGETGTGKISVLDSEKELQTEHWVLGGQLPGAHIHEIGALSSQKRNSGR